MRRSDPEREANRHRRLLEEAQAIAHVGSWEWDIVSGTLLWTAETYRIFGVDPSVFTPTIENGLACIHEDDVPRVQSSLGTTIEVGKPYSLVTRIRRPDGEIRWIESVGVPSIIDGLVVSVIGTVLDVTARELSHASLRASEARLAEAQRLALLGNWEFSVRSRVLTCSSELFLVIGVDPEVGIVSFDRFMLLVHPDDRVRAQSFLARVQTDYMALSDELRIITPKGDERWLALRATPVVDTTGQVTEMRGTLQDITERKASEQQLVHLALHDMLTGLPNRSLFNDRLQQALIRRDSSAAVMLLDLDGFKAINDGLGHAAGDALLVAVADRLCGALRSCDTVARFGGDEFTVLVEGEDKVGARMTADRLLNALAAPFEIEGRNVLAQASIGVALGCDGSHRPDELIRDADAAMYAAKRKGGGRYEIFSAELHTTIVERMALEFDLRSVELGTEMTLQYQPLVDLRDGRLVGFEALLRWHHPKHGPISPVDFIPIAELTGAIVPIGRWVVDEACRQSRLWQQHYPAAGGLAMNVNVSARQLADTDIVHDVARALKVSGLDPELLTLEITETMIMADEDEAGEILQQLKGLGVRISVDDFGTGYSSLGHLDRFPIDELKIDRSFVTRLGAGATESGVALAIIRLAHSLHIEVVAEGIEREDQLVQLRRAHCTRGQGYYFWRPLDVAAVEELLQDLPRSVLPRELARVVLVVDDETEVRRSTTRVLAAAGYEVIEAATGHEAIHAVRTRPLDAVVLDVDLSDVSDIEICAKLRELSQDDLPVVHLSLEVAAVDDRVRGLDLGADGYLVKPVAPAELVATLGSLLRNRRRRTPTVSRQNQPAGARRSKSGA